MCVSGPGRLRRRPRILLREGELGSEAAGRLAFLMPGEAPSGSCAVRQSIGLCRGAVGLSPGWQIYVRKNIPNNQYKIRFFFPNRFGSFWPDKKKPGVAGRGGWTMRVELISSGLLVVPHSQFCYNYQILQILYSKPDILHGAMPRI